jgi:short subunit dehydrogenase-like uncharacterized protein
MSQSIVAVFGATGHTGHFVVKELRRHGLVPALLGRDADKLARLHDEYRDSEVRVAAVDDAAALDRALSGVSAIINCAGPFLDTARAVISAALRAHVPYLDVTAEQACAQATFEEFADAAKEANVAVVPAMAFYGGLADLLATATMGDWGAADEIVVAIALDSWWPTLGTRLTGKRNTARRFFIVDGAPAVVGDPPLRRSWTFPAPFGAQEVLELPFSEIVTISRHLRARDVRSYMNLAPLRDLSDPSTPPPRAADETGRAAQRFVMDVVVRNGSRERRGTATGRDIYALTAPLVVEAAERILDGRATRVGTLAPGELFDARDFLTSLKEDLFIRFTQLQ